MTNKEMVISVLNDHGGQDGFQIKGSVYRKFGASITSNSAAGIMRPLIAAGYAGKSPNPANGKMVYWLTPLGKEKLIK